MSLQFVTYSFSIFHFGISASSHAEAWFYESDTEADEEVWSSHIWVFFCADEIIHQKVILYLFLKALSGALCCAHALNTVNVALLYIHTLSILFLWLILINYTVFKSLVVHSANKKCSLSADWGGEV